MAVERPEVERLLTAVGFFVAPKDGRLAVAGPGLGVPTSPARWT